MPKKNPFDVARDARGNYKRTIGVKQVGEDYTPHTFYLGRDYGQACINGMNLEKCWNAVHERWYRESPHSTPRACWDDTTLEIAKAVAAGKNRVEVQHPFEENCNLLHWNADSDMNLLKWLADLRSMFPFIVIELANEALRDKTGFTLDRAEEKVDRQAAAIKELRAVTTAKGTSLGHALDAYGDSLLLLYKGPDGLLSEFGGNCQRRLTSIRDELADRKDTSIAKIDNRFIEDWVARWASRPQTKRGKPCSVDWAKGVIKTIRHFVRWLHRADLGWHKPTEYEVMPVRIKETHDEIAADEEIKRYRRAEIAVLWEYATPRERVFLLLGLNCGFGLREIATLRISQVKFKDDRAIIKRRRTKTKVWGRWVLWPETVAALRWYLGHRPENESPYFFLTRSGAPLVSKTKGGNLSQIIPNMWAGLRDRITKDKEHESFPKLSFNKLRKTGANWIRRKFGAEIADLYLAHGKKDMVDAYTNKPFARLSKPLARLHKSLGLMAVVWPEKDRAPNTVVSRGTIKRIQELRRQGFTLKKVSAELKLAISTIRKYEHVAL